jgi:ferredoxin
VRYGFVIDQRKCIGCHACTVACKSEHEVPVGVFRTWVKYVESGEFPQVRRHFSVLRCNHCEAAPCVTACPTKALYKRPDATHVLYTEDDIDLASDIVDWLPALRALGAAATLYVTGDIHYPLVIRQQLFGRQPLDTGIVPLERLKRWYGTLAVLLPRDLAEAVLCWESGVHGWDLQLQHFLVAHALPLYVTVPNLVQHRGVPTVASPAGGHERSATYGMAVKGQRLTVG